MARGCRPESDLTHYVFWTRLATLEGVENSYRGTWPETRAAYGPVVLYSYAVAGHAYRWLLDPTFGMDDALSSAWLRSAVKGVAVAWHLLAGAAIFLVVSRAAGMARACLAAALYVANPAALFDAAHWGEPDGAQGALMVLGIGLLAAGRTRTAWSALAAAALSKPQAWPLIPFATLATYHDFGARGVVRTTAAAVGAAALMALPFVAGGRILDVLTLPTTVTSAMPVVTANAHNGWWIVTAIRGMLPLSIPDTAPLVGPITYRMVAAGLIGVDFLFAFWLYRSGRAPLMEAAALVMLGWFVCTTQAHENHSMAALTLLAATMYRRRFLLAAFAVASLSGFLNEALQDPAFLRVMALAPDAKVIGPGVAALRSANAVAISLCFLVWCIAAARRPLCPSRSVDR